MNTAPARSVIKKGGLARVPGPGPGPGPAQRARHTCIGLQDLPGSFSPAWKEERRKKKEVKGRKRKQKEERRKKKQKEERSKKIYQEKEGRGKKQKDEGAEEIRRKI